MENCHPGNIIPDVGQGGEKSAIKYIFGQAQIYFPWA